MALDANQFLQEIRNRDPHLALLLQRMMDGVATLGQHIGVSTTGKTQPPDPIKDISVKAGDSHVHVTLNDPSPVRKGIQYFVEWSHDQGASWHVEHLGASREKMLALPALKDDGVTPNVYNFRSYSQHPGSDAQSKKAVFGGSFTPAAVTLTGASKMTPLAATGSGTAAPDGSQGGQGLGTSLQRLPQGPKIPQAPKKF